jgi:hypothetical protein
MGRQRDEKGRFIKGHTGNPNGRMPKTREIKYYELTISAVSEADWVEIVKAAVKQAIRGDNQARKWLSDYLIGMPQQKVDLTTNGENINSIGITGVDYRSAIANLAPRSMGDSDSSGEGESAFDGETVG